METGIAVVVVIVSIVCGSIGAHNLQDKGRSPALGFAIGFVLGIIGVVLTVAMAPSYERQLHRHEQLTRELAAKREQARGDGPYVPMRERRAREMRDRGPATFKPRSEASPASVWLSKEREPQEHDRQPVEERMERNLQRARDPENEK